MNRGRGPGGRPVPAPAADLPPQSFGRNDAWLGWVLFCAFVTGLIEAFVAIGRAFGRFGLADFLFPIVLYSVVASFAVIFPATWVAGGDGWLMRLRGRTPQAWVRTSRLVHVSLESRYEGEGDYAPYLTLRDVDGRELATWLRKLTPDAAASLLRGIRQSSEAELANLSPPEAQAALTALGEVVERRSRAALTAESAKDGD